MPQPGNFHPRNGVVFLFELGGQVGHMFPDVVQGSGNRPLNGLLVKDSFGGNVFPADVGQQFLGGFLDLGDSLLVTVFHAICTPSPIIVS